MVYDQRSIDISNESYYILVITGLLPFSLSNTLSKNRIGPHNKDIISVIIGNLLGDGHGEKRVGSTRFTIHMGSPNVEYLM